MLRESGVATNGNLIEREEIRNRAPISRNSGAPSLQRWGRDCSAACSLAAQRLSNRAPTPEGVGHPTTKDLHGKYECPITPKSYTATPCSDSARSSYIASAHSSLPQPQPPISPFPCRSAHGIAPENTFRFTFRVRFHKAPIGSDWPPTTPCPPQTKAKAQAG